MQPLRFAINITLDGCCHHLAMVPNEAMFRYHTNNLARAGAMLFGRVTYGMMEEAWRPPAPPDAPEWVKEFTHTMSSAKKYVVSNTLERVDWNAELVRGEDLEGAVRRLKREPGNGVFVSGVKLGLALTELGLIDEYELLVQPRFAGHGPTLFAGLSKPVDLKFVGRQELDGGLVALKYAR